MTHQRFLNALLAAGLIAAVPTVGFVQEPARAPANRDRIEAALKFTRAAAAEYEFRTGDEKAKPLELRREPVLEWSNPEVGETHGNAFVWTRGSRPLVIGCLFNWFSPTATRMEHEFHSLSEEPMSGGFHGEPVWKTEEAGLRFADLPGASAPAAGDGARLLQLKQLAKEFSASGKFGTNPTAVVLRLLPQPLFRYSAPKEDIIAGGLFAFVRATDPEVVLLIEARGKDAANSRWQFAAVRMHSMAELRLSRRNQRVWESGPLRFEDAFEKHTLPYTAFRFKQIPAFLKSTVPGARP